MLALLAEYQQQRLAGNLPVKANKYVESWSTNREHIELTYKWDRVLLDAPLPCMVPCYSSQL